MFEVVVFEHALVDGFDVVDEGDVEVGVEESELVEIEGGEEAMLPAEGGVGVDEDVFVVGHVGEDVAEDGASEGVEASEGEIEDAARADVGCFGVHHVADVVDLEVFAVGACDGGGMGDEGFFIEADLAGEEGAHEVAFRRGTGMMGDCSGGRRGLPIGDCRLPIEGGWGGRWGVKSLSRQVVKSSRR